MGSPRALWGPSQFTWAKGALWVHQGYCGASQLPDLGHYGHCGSIVPENVRCFMGNNADEG